MRWRAKTLTCFWLSYVVSIPSAWKNGKMFNIMNYITVCSPLSVGFPYLLSVWTVSKIIWMKSSCLRSPRRWDASFAFPVMSADVKVTSDEHMLAVSKEMGCLLCPASHVSWCQSNFWWASACGLQGDGMPPSALPVMSANAEATSDEHMLVVSKEMGYCLLCPSSRVSWCRSSLWCTLQVCYQGLEVLQDSCQGPFRCEAAT